MSFTAHTHVPQRMTFLSLPLVSTSVTSCSSRCCRWPTRVRGFHGSTAYRAVQALKPNTGRLRTGNDGPSNVRSPLKPPFTGLGLSMPVVVGLKAAFPNVKQATDAQHEFIPAVMSGKDVLLKGHTGSGKCVAFRTRHTHTR